MRGQPSGQVRGQGTKGNDPTQVVSEVEVEDTLAFLDLSPSDLHPRRHLGISVGDPRCSTTTSRRFSRRAICTAVAPEAVRTFRRDTTPEP